MRFVKTFLTTAVIMSAIIGFLVLVTSISLYFFGSAGAFITMLIVFPSLAAAVIEEWIG